jgi:Rod binding domain-containing protein
MVAIAGSSALSKDSSLWDLGTNAAANATKTSGLSEADKIAEAARGFETTLVRQMLREIHNSPFNPKEDTSNKAYLEMVDDQMAATITKGNGLGFAKKMTEQLLNQSQIAKQINAQKLTK